MRHKSARHLSLVRFRHSAAHHAPDRQFASWSEHRFHARSIDGLEFRQYPRFTDFHAFVVYNNLRQRKNSVELSVTLLSSSWLRKGLIHRLFHLAGQMFNKLSFYIWGKNG
jgi:hypothetical protein